MALNQLIVRGKVASEVKTNVSQSGLQISKLKLAIPAFKKGGNTSYYIVTGFGKVAEIMQKSIGKGSDIIVIGKLSQSSWKDKQGTTHNTTEIVAFTIDFIKLETAQPERPKEPPVEEFATFDEVPGDSDEAPF